MERARLENFLDFCCVDLSFVTLRRRTRQDIEVMGNGYWEVLRDGGGEIVQFVYIPGFTMRLLPLDPGLVEIDAKVKVSEISFDTMTNEGLFDTFTAAQEVSAALLLRALVSRFGWTREVSVYGHVDFDPARKEDPGPIWKRTVLPRVLDKVFGGGAVASASNAGTAGQGG